MIPNCYQLIQSILKIFIKYTVNFYVEAWLIVLSNKCIISKGVIFAEFDQYWFVTESTVMSFERVSKIFFTNIANKLKHDPHTIIRESFMAKKF